MTKSLEDYIEAIHLRSREAGAARVVDVAKTLGVKMPSVNTAVKELAKMGLIAHKPYRHITLTPEGRAKAEAVFQRHTILKEFLLSIGVPPDNAENDACAMEHCLSAETLERLKRLTAQSRKRAPAAKKSAAEKSAQSGVPEMLDAEAQTGEIRERLGGEHTA